MPFSAKFLLFFLLKMNDLIKKFLNYDHHIVGQSVYVHNKILKIKTKNHLHINQFKIKIYQGYQNNLSLITFVNSLFILNLVCGLI